MTEGTADTEEGQEMGVLGGGGKGFAKIARSGSETMSSEVQVTEDRDMSIKGDLQLI